MEIHDIQLKINIIDVIGKAFEASSEQVVSEHDCMGHGPLF